LVVRLAENIPQMPVVTGQQVFQLTEILGIKHANYIFIVVIVVEALVKIAEASRRQSPQTPSFIPFVYLYVFGDFSGYDYPV
jgi:hypothetical protein